MRDLPFTLKDCGERATHRIEVYSGAADRRSLDAVAYVCPTHPDPATRAIASAGFTASVAPVSGRAVTRGCGSVHVFPTGMLAAPDRHPRWCDRNGCVRRGEHRSRISDVDTNRPEASILTVGLVQVIHPAVEPVVALTATDGTASDRVVLSIGQVRVLRYRLATLLDAAKGGRR